mmetsp:Transcript_12553/g.38365  ORF Transcript_12553/g.38365 Transcript_12553/m.38365 type:complete len:378 (+) Transcript_12553:194-1327(+)|eukprot:CAMPEP_0198724922 /NCGR_PEP_ID=MMETSP1475-20131203/2309_1 /TAXON_ID= ORGANISM="Unidentified sp., Strain CCMP1999" /NCGR_SAMPLE_ID=MMETSP1475 /ASSEMBLY_ACC=CAM_ASM_001111 /LENGTH=377 /DNA_ID=CAMNT_0044486563 /DNA_START=178 /DNA_END=1311 /DNA_ORIENTATION=+
MKGCAFVSGGPIAVGRTTWASSPVTTSARSAAVGLPLRVKPIAIGAPTKPARLATRMMAESTASSPAPSQSNTAQVGFYFGLWYFLNVIFNIINKKTLNMWSYPWTISLVQLGVGAAYCSIQWIIGTRRKPKVSWNLIRALTLPALAHTLGHVMSCLSFSSVAISFTHIVKSAEPVFGAVCAAAFLNETYPWYVYLSLVPVILGVALSSATELTFTWMGFTTAMISNLAFAMRNVFSKVTMGEYKKDTSLPSENIYGLISIMAFLMELPFALYFDNGIPEMVSRVAGVGFPVLFRYFMSSCLLYHLYNEVSYLALGNVSPVTFSVGNTIKRVIIILSSIVVFQTKILPLNAIGSAVAIIGTFLYSMSKNKAAAAKAK